ncbi:hypothetical protein fugu_015176 [Takifugu bimaculatus]|uniref:Uncharacterized protein n=1 Tax=Takifugu bimaculatus TaxID=433685 RepID=A0A4Z2BZZ1_9TELE|nr:hypothetical protein fugu_015176 [Takifugu bimaculatus]
MATTERRSIKKRIRRHRESIKTIKTQSRTSQTEHRREQTSLEMRFKGWRRGRRSNLREPSGGGAEFQPPSGKPPSPDGQGGGGAKPSGNGQAYWEPVLGRAAGQSPRGWLSLASRACFLY